MTCLSEDWRIALPPTCDSSRLPLSDELDSAVWVMEGLGPHRVLLRFLRGGVGTGPLHSLLPGADAREVRFVTKERKREREKKKREKEREKRKGEKREREREKRKKEKREREKERKRERARERKKEKERESARERESPNCGINMEETGDQKTRKEKRKRPKKINK